MKFHFFKKKKNEKFSLWIGIFLIKHLDIITTSTLVYGVVFFGPITIYPLFIIQFLWPKFKVYAKPFAVVWVQIFGLKK